MATCHLCWPPAILFYRCSLDLSPFFAALSPTSLSRSPPNFATCSTLTQIYKKFGHKFGWPLLPPKFGGPKTSKFRRDFAQLRDLIANVSGTQQDIVNRKTALQTTDTPAQANLIRYTLVHKRWKIGLNFWPTQWTAIRLGIASGCLICF